MVRPRELPLSKGGERTLQRDLPAAAGCPSRGWGQYCRPSLGKARPHQQLPALHSLLCSTSQTAISTPAPAIRAQH